MEWLHGLMRAAHLIGRYAVGRAAHADGASVRAARDVCAALLEGVTPFDLRDAGLVQAYDGLVRVVRRLEETLYELSLATDVGDAADDDADADADASPPPTDALVDVIALEEALQRRAAADVAREGTTKRCHELGRLAKAAVSTLHRRAALCAPRCSSRRSPRAAEASCGPSWASTRSCGSTPTSRHSSRASSARASSSLGLRRPAASFWHSADELSVADVGVDEYLCAVGDFAAELSRYAVARATARDAAAVRACLGTTLCLQAAALRIGTLCRAVVEARMEALHAAARNMERLLYEQSLMERTAYAARRSGSRRLPFGRAFIHTVVIFFGRLLDILISDDRHERINRHKQTRPAAGVVPR